MALKHQEGKAPRAYSKKGTKRMDYEWWERKAIQETLDKIDQIEKDNRQLWDWCIELKKQFPKGTLLYKNKQLLNGINTRAKWYASIRTTSI